MDGTAEAESICGIISHVSREYLKLEFKGVDRCVVLLNLRNLRPYFGSPYKVSSYQYATSNQPDDDQHHRKFYECETGYGLFVQWRPVLKDTDIIIFLSFLINMFALVDGNNLVSFPL